MTQKKETVKATTEPTATPIPTDTPTPELTETPTPTEVPTPELRTESTEEQNVRQETYYDYAGNKVKGEGGFVTRIQVMSKDLVIAESWLDENGQPVPMGDEPYYKVEYTYDKMGNINREKYYDKDGQPIRCNDGYAIVYREYDAYNRVEYEKFYDTDGFAIMLDDGAVSYRYQYDDAGEMIKKTKYDYGDHEVE